MANRTSDRIRSASFSADRVRKTCPPVSSARSQKADGIAPHAPTISVRWPAAPATSCPQHRPLKRSRLLREKSLALCRVVPELNLLPTGYLPEGYFLPLRPASSRPARSL